VASQPPGSVNIAESRPVTLGCGEVVGGYNTLDTTVDTELSLVELTHRLGLVESVIWWVAFGLGRWNGHGRHRL